MQTFTRIFSILALVAMLGGCQSQARKGGVATTNPSEPTSRPVASASGEIDESSTDSASADPEIRRLNNELLVLRARILEIQARDEKLAAKVVELNRLTTLQEDQIKAAGTALAEKDKLEKQISDMTVQIQVLTRENAGLRRLLTMSSAQAAK